MRNLIICNIQRDGLMNDSFTALSESVGVAELFGQKLRTLNIPDVMVISEECHKSSCGYWIDVAIAGEVEAVILKIMKAFEKDQKIFIHQDFELTDWNMRIEAIFSQIRHL